MNYSLLQVFKAKRWNQLSVFLPAFFAPLFFLANPILFAQVFTKELPVEQVTAQGFYRVLISPEISSAANGNFTSLRLYDHNNNEIPYIFSEESPSISKSEFREYEIIKKEIRKQCCTNLILRNPGKKTISNISLFIKNAETTKKAKLTGSDDGENWYAIKESFYFHGINNRESTMELKSIEFPPSNYALYALAIDDSSSAPLNIVKAGFYETVSQSGNYMKIPALEFTQNDSAHTKKTYARIEFPELVLIDKIELGIDGPAYYLRNARLLAKQEKILKKGKKVEYLEPLQHFTLNSSKANAFFLPAIKAKELFLEIDNHDAPALSITDIKAFQINRYLTAHLNANSQYFIRIPSKELPPPVYDLAHFKDSVPSGPPIIRATEIVDISSKEKVSEATLFTNKNIIWAAIIGVILIMGYMSLKMAKEAGKE